MSDSYNPCQCGAMKYRRALHCGPCGHAARVQRMRAQRRPCGKCGASICGLRRFCETCQRAKRAELVRRRRRGQVRASADIPAHVIEAVIERDLARKRALRWGRL
jgi:hypothetical protein